MAGRVMNWHRRNGPTLALADERESMGRDAASRWIEQAGQPAKRNFPHTKMADGGIFVAQETIWENRTADDFVHNFRGRRSYQAKPSGYIVYR